MYWNFSKCYISPVVVIYYRGAFSWVVCGIWQATRWYKIFIVAASYQKFFKKRQWHSQHEHTIAIYLYISLISVELKLNLEGVAIDHCYKSKQIRNDSRNEIILSPFWQTHSYIACWNEPFHFRILLLSLSLVAMIHPYSFLDSKL